MYMQESYKNTYVYDIDMISTHNINMLILLDDLFYKTIRQIINEKIAIKFCS